MDWEKNKHEEVMVNIGICPRCGAKCVEGNDDDMMITCAICGHTFIPKTVTPMTDSEYREMAENAIERKERSGWLAFRSK